MFKNNPNLAVDPSSRFKNIKYEDPICHSPTWVLNLDVIHIGKHMTHDGDFAAFVLHISCWWNSEPPNKTMVPCSTQLGFQPSPDTHGFYSRDLHSEDPDLRISEPPQSHTSLVNIANQPDTLQNNDKFFAGE